MAGKPREAFTVGWICALSHELTASRAMLDEEYAAFEQQDEYDDNNYVTGRIKSHDIVMACLPSGKMGKASAATVATNMMRSFPSIRFALLVGIGGAGPGFESLDIRLGDVVVSKPNGEHGGVIQYDMGKATPNGFHIRGYLNSPPSVLLSGLGRLQSEHEIRSSRILEYMSTALKNFPRLEEHYSYPGFSMDELWKDQMPVERLVRRDAQRKADWSPHVFYGLIGSGDRVIANAKERDRLPKDVLCVEMEAAGLMNTFPCLVVRGICDYADASKHDEFQRYAAIAAAAYAKELLENVPAGRVKDAKPIEAASTTQVSSVAPVNPMPLREIHNKDSRQTSGWSNQVLLGLLRNIGQTQSNTVNNHNISISGNNNTVTTGGNNIVNNNIINGNVTNSSITNNISQCNEQPAKYPLGSSSHLQGSRARAKGVKANTRGGSGFSMGRMAESEDWMWDSDDSD